jgi:hypothetical protein
MFETAQNNLLNMNNEANVVGEPRSSTSLFKYGRASKGRKYAFAAFILSLVALLDVVEAKKCKYNFELISVSLSYEKQHNIKSTNS